MEVSGNGFRRSYPDSHYQVTTDIPWSMGLDAGGLFTTCGQVDMDPAGNVLHLNDYGEQTRQSLNAIDLLLKDLELEKSVLRSLVVFYKAGGRPEIASVVFDFVSDIPHEVAIAYVPLPYLTYEGMVVEIDAYGITDNAVNDQGDQKSRWEQLRFLPSLQFHHAVAGELDDSVGSLADALNETLSQHPASLNIENMLYLVICAPNGAGLEKLCQTVHDIQTSRSLKFPVTKVFGTDDADGNGFSIHGIAGLDSDAIERSFVDSANPLGCKLIGWNGLYFLKSAIEDPSRLPNIADQSRVEMEHLLEGLKHVGLDRSDVVKLNTTYCGSQATDDYHRSLKIRKSHFQRLGPCSTGVPISKFALPGRQIEIDAMSVKAG